MGEHVLASKALHLVSFQDASHVSTTGSRKKFNKLPRKLYVQMVTS